MKNVTIANVTNEQIVFLKRMAKKNGMTVTSYIKTLILKEMEKSNGISIK